MEGDALHTIGELSRLTGIPVKTIRFWPDAGVVPPTDRTPAGYRLYGRDAPPAFGREVPPCPPRALRLYDRRRRMLLRLLHAQRQEDILKQ
ncbi:hypothetical protein P3T39_000033 [Kitasatospora sp. GP82]|nr:hypothetical protein [Kitasatospora sp. GP82]